MITQLKVYNYRSLGDFRISLEPLTVFVGHNGSGKSNVVDALRFISDALNLGLRKAVMKRRGINLLRRKSTEKQPHTIHFGLDIETETIVAHYYFSLKSTPRGTYQILSEVCKINEFDINGTVEFETWNGKWHETPPGLTPVIQEDYLVLPLLAGTPPYRYLYDFLTGFSFYTIFPNALTKPQKLEDPYPLEEDGTNLASVLQKLQESKSPLLTSLKNAIKHIIPDITDFKIMEVGGYLVTTLVHKMSKDEFHDFELLQESDGTLRILSILTALYQDPPRTLIGLEEPELAIHPGALNTLWDEIEDAANRSQIILTTHSPDLLDLCTAEQLRVVDKIDGTTEVGPIENEQKEIIRKRLFAPGELLRAQGLYRVESTEASS